MLDNQLLQPIKPSDEQHSLLLKMLSPELENKDALLKQSSAYTVKSVPYDDNYGSFDILPDKSLQPANVPDGVISIGETYDKDGMSIGILLHVYEGYLSEVEIVRDDGEPMIGQIDVDSVNVSRRD